MRDKNKKILAIVGGLIVVIIIILLLVKGCGKKEYVINFDSQGGSNVTSVTVLKDDTLTKPKDPTREGYEFLGWYLDGKLFDFSEKITKNMVLEARWKKVEKEVTGISLNATLLTLKPNGTGLLSVIFTPEGATSELVWSSSDEEIVTVKDGELKALKKGEVIITVTTKDGKYKATCKVKVEDNVISVTSVSISGKKEVNVGESIKLTASIKPKDATNKEVTWTSSDSTIATIDKNGNVKGIKSGKVTITVTTVDGEKKASISIEVKEKKTETTPSNPSTPSTPSTTPEDKPSTPTNPSTGNTPSTGEQETPKVAVDNVVISGAKEVYVDESIKLTTNITPSNATDKTLKWESSNPNIATVNSDGTVIGKSHGTVKIKVTASNGKTYEYEITVVEYIITLTKLVQPGGSVVQYEITSVVANGVNQDTALFTYNGITYALEDERIDSNDVDEKVTTATLKFNGKDVKAKVKYLSRNI